MALSARSIIQIRLMFVEKFLVVNPMVLLAGTGLSRARRARKGKCNPLFDQYFDTEDEHPYHQNFRGHGESA